MIQSQHSLTVCSWLFLSIMYIKEWNIKYTFAKFQVHVLQDSGTIERLWSNRTLESALLSTLLSPPFMVDWIVMTSLTRWDTFTKSFACHLLKTMWLFGCFYCVIKGVASLAFLLLVFSHWSFDVEVWWLLLVPKLVLLSAKVQKTRMRWPWLERAYREILKTNKQTKNPSL